jgi:hypothetical protein
MKHAPLCICDKCQPLRGHTDECQKFWEDVMVMDSIGERWDHWTQPKCDKCDERRKAKGIK